MAAIFFQTNSIIGQCVLACNDKVNVDLQIDGNRVITEDMILEAPQFCPFPLDVDVFINGVSIGNTINCSYLGETLDVTVTEPMTGNSCDSRIKIEDKSGPLLICKSDTIVPCGLDPMMILGPTIIDNCDPNPVLFYTDSVVNFICEPGPYIKIIYRKWKGRDVENNLSFPCSQVIYFEKSNLSTVVFPNDTCVLDTFSIPLTPANIDQFAGAPSFNGQPITNYCKFNIFYDDTRLEICEGSYKLLRKWTVLNCCTNESKDDYQIIEIKDLTPPEIICPADTTISTSDVICSADFNLPPATVIDNRTQNPTVKVEWSGGTIFSNGGFVSDLAVGIHEFLYIAEDGCGNKDSCVYKVTVIDDVPPVPICISSITITANPINDVCILADSLDKGSYDNCCLDSIAAKIMGEPDNLFREEICFNCSDVPGPVMVIVRFIDCYNNSNECMVEVNIDDKLPPTITCPVDVILDCTFDFRDTTFTGFPTATDNCDSVAFSFMDDTTQLTLCNTGKIIRTWTATDAGGLTNTCEQSIILIDTTSTQFINIPNDTILFCPIDITNLPTAEPEAQSDCELWKLSTVDSRTIQLCTTIIERRFTFVEWCSGADTSFSQLIRIIDNTAPEWDQMAGDLDTTFQCAAEAVGFDAPTATDGCDSNTMVAEVRRDTTPGSCPNDFEVDVAYLAADRCGNMSDTFFVKLTVSDTIAPVISGILNDTIISCEVNFPNPANLRIRDNCGSVSTTSFTVPLSTTCPIVERVEQLFIAIDRCDNRDTISRIVSKIDTVPPTAPMPTDSIYGCPEDIPAADPGVVIGESDNCGGTVTVSLFQDDVIENRCIDTLNRIYRLEDPCGNFSFVNHRLILNDTIEPRVTSCPGAFIDTMPFTANGICQLEVELNAFYIDNCASSNITISHDSPFAFDIGGPSATGIYPLGTHKFTFTGTDECLNANTECEVELTVTEINQPGIACKPGPIFLELDSMGNAALTNRDVFDLKNPIIQDWCSNVIFNITPNTFNCDDFSSNPNNAVQVVGTVRDTFFNTASCQTTVILRDPTGACSNIPPLPPGAVGGVIHYVDQHIIKDIDVRLSGSQSDMFNTESSGIYKFENLNTGSNFVIAPFKNDNHPLGVNTFDLILVRRMILGEGEFTPYQYIAADVNKSGGISVMDLIEMRKVILQQQTEFKYNTAWRFIDNEYVFPNPENPFLEQFPETIFIETHTHSKYDYDFTAVKTGDINQNAYRDSIQSVTDRSNRKSAYFEVANQTFKKGEKVVTYLSSLENLIGFQFALEFENDLLQFENLEPNAAILKMDNFNLAEAKDGLLLTSFDGKLFPKQPLFKLEFIAISDGILAKAISIKETTLTPQAYTSDLKILNPILKFSGTQVEVTSSFELFQNKPNPFNKETVIECWVQNEMNGKLEIFDLAGKLVFKEEKKMEEGVNEFKINGNNFSTNGVYFYKLTTPFGVETKRMMYLN